MADKPERRDLSFKSLDEAVADVEKLAAGEVRTTGNHSFAEILKHLAISNNMSTGRIEAPRPPFFIRLIMPVMKRFILNTTPKPGFKLPQKSENFFWPGGDIDLQEAVAEFKDSVEHYNSNGPLDVHPMFGRATREQIDRLNTGHCAMHLSFVHPVT